MVSIPEALANSWIARRAAPDPAALATIANLKPATVITGASRGIGLALASEWARKGDRVVIIARQPAALNAAAARISKEFSVEVFALPLDVTTPGAARAIDAFLEANSLYCDSLINNAGLGLAGPMSSHAPDAIEKLITLNITALTILTRHVLPGMVARGRGGILNIASLGGFVPGPNQAAYYASKAYVISLTRALADEVAGRGVRIAVVVPGPVATGFHDAMGAGASAYLRLMPVSTPEQIARSAVRGFRNGRRIIGPGVLATLGSYALRVLPYALSAPIIGRMLAVPLQRRD